MPLKKILSLGILLIVTTVILSKDRAIAEFLTAETNTVETERNTNNLANDSNTMSQTQFGIKIFQQIRQQNTEANIFVSPLSLGIALSMLYNGAEGITQKELASLLEVMNLSKEQVNQDNKILVETLENSDEKVQIAIANSLWTKPNLPIKESFLATNQQYYDATVRELDFTEPTATQIINDWVAESTNNKIAKVVEQISPEQALYLINAIYFKGQWQTKFNPENTTKQNFYLADGESKQHPLMSDFNEYKYYENLDFQLINLPYGSGSLGMNIFLPQKSSNLTKFFEQLNSENLASWVRQMKLKEGNLQVPRFKQEYETDLNGILQQLGASSMFSSERANFTALSNLATAVDEVKHKAVIEVNEEGTEAAAVTGIGSLTTSVETPFNMIVNRPFFFTIQDEATGVILFMGTVQNPVE